MSRLARGRKLLRQMLASQRPAIIRKVDGRR